MLNSLTGPLRSNRMEAGPLLGRNIHRTPDGGRPLTGRTRAIPAIFRRPGLPARLIFSAGRQTVALGIASALLSCTILLALAPRCRLPGSFVTPAILSDLPRAILGAQFTSLLGRIPAAVLRRTIIAGGGATRHCARTLMHGAGSHV
jgi:hypothetical protein